MRAQRNPPIDIKLYDSCGVIHFVHCALRGLIRNEEDLRRHLDYIHWNPVKHGCVRSVAEWPYSSFHRYVRDGVYAADWGGVGAVLEGDFGE